MRLGYFTMPMHPFQRPWAETLQEDRQIVMLADKLGYYDAFIGEHLTDANENITNSLLFLATLISETTHIKLATGTTNLSQQHPALIATHAAMFDHLAKGRFIMGISPGNLRTDAEAIGNLDEDRTKLFEEAIDVILEIWTRDPPYNIDLPNNRFKVSTAKTARLEIGLGILGKPYQKPYPEIVGTVVAPYSKGVIAMGKRDFHPLSANFLLPKWVKTHWANYSQGKTEVGKTPDITEWRVARTIFVCEDDKVAARYARHDANSPYLFYFQQLLAKFRASGRLALFKDRMDQPDSEITDDYVMDTLVWYGSVNKIVDHILAFREEIGEFGELVYCGVDWTDPALSRRSMELMATEVMPRVNRAIGTARSAAQVSGSSAERLRPTAAWTPSPTASCHRPAIDIGEDVDGADRSRGHCAAAASARSAARSAQAQSLEEFYRGKQLNMIIGYPTGGSQRHLCPRGRAPYRQAHPGQSRRSSRATCRAAAA